MQRNHMLFSPRKKLYFANVYLKKILYTTNEVEFDLFVEQQQGYEDETTTELCNEAECDAFGN